MPYKKKILLFVKRFCSILKAVLFCEKKKKLKMFLIVHRCEYLRVFLFKSCVKSSAVDNTVSHAL